MKTEKIEIRVSKNQKEMIQAMASKEDYSISQFIQVAIIDYIMMHYEGEEQKNKILEYSRA
jgi:predicted HicB family RNase H-like nuclease